MLSQLLKGLARMLLAILILVPGTPGVKAAPQPPEDVDRLPSLRFPGDPPIVNQAALAQPALNFTPIDPWARLVYESYQDGNWEIYLWGNSSDAGAAPVRLTADQGVDIHARLNRGATKIAFASNRSGNYEIYLMNTDGSGLVQLTANASDDVSPYWSPDGASIVFQSYRDGQAEIYRMKADGSGQTRLTSNPGYDGQPAWSPVEDVVAYTSYQNGGYRIWRMNADGSGKYQLSNIRYSENPVWSPDGELIAYDANTDTAGSQDLFVMDKAGGENDLMGIYPPDQVDILPRSWSLDGSQIFFTRASWEVVNQNIFYTSAYIGSFTYSSAGTSTLYSDSGVDFNPDWQSRDILAPQSQMADLPDFSKMNFPYSWSGEDRGESGLARFEIQYRIGLDGPWKYKGNPVLPGSDTFTYESPVGAQLFFRARAKDRASNVEAWPADFDAVTTLYSWSMDGFVNDVRGNPRSNASLSFTPLSIEWPRSDLEGRYLAHFAPTVSTEVTIEPPKGYSGLPATTFPGGSDLSYNWALPSGLNWAQNPGFEEGVAGWTLSGESEPIPVVGDRHSGSGALALGDLAAQKTKISNSQGVPGNWKTAPKIGEDAGGTFYAVWREQNPSNYVLSTKPPGGVWSLPELVAPASPFLSSTAFVAAPDGTLYLAWTALSYNDRRVWVVTRPPGGVWSSPVPLSGLYEFDYSASPLEMVMAGNGDVFVFWYQVDTGLRAARKPAGMDWIAPVNLGVNGPQYKVALDPAGNPHLMAMGVYPDTTAWMVDWQGGGTWSQPVQLPAGLPSGGLREFIWDTAGRKQALLVASNQLLLYTLGAGGGWEPAVVVYGAPVNETIQNVDAELQTDSSLHILWNLGNPSGEISRAGYKVRRADGSFSDAYLSWGKQMNAVDMVVSGGTAHWVWYELATNQDSSEIFYATIALTRGQQSSASQLIEIPASAHAPTLSFAYRIEAEESERRTLQAAVNGAPVFSTHAATTGWAYAWADLSPWAGQEVTLTLSSLAGEAGAPILALVDEVTVSEWLTPLVERLDVASCAPGTLTLHGTNFVATPSIRIGAIEADAVRWIDAVTLEADFNAGLSPGWQDLQVTNPGDQDAVLKRGFHCGLDQFIPLVNR